MVTRKILKTSEERSLFEECRRQFKEKMKVSSEGFERNIQGSWKLEKLQEIITVLVSWIKRLGKPGGVQKKSVNHLVEHYRNFLWKLEKLPGEDFSFQAPHRLDRKKLLENVRAIIERISQKDFRYLSEETSRRTWKDLPN